MNEKLEEKLAQIGELSYNSLSIPESVDILEKTKNVKQRSKLYFRARFILFTVMILIVTLLSGFTIKHYYFRDFKAQQDNGEINIYNIVRSKKGTKIKLEAVYSDGLDTYVKIKANGFKNIPNVDSNAGIANKLKQVYLTDESGNKWEWRKNETTTFSGGSITEIGADFDVSGLLQNEAVLYFEGTPADGAKINFKFVFNNGTVIKFSDLTIHVTKTVIRDISDLNLTIDLPYAQGEIQKITYSKTQSEFVVDWTVDDQLYMEYTDYLEKHKMFLDNGADEFRWYDFTPHQQSEGKVLTNNCLIFGTIKPNQTLTIKLYNQNFIQDDKYKEKYFNKVMCVIPPME